MREGEIPNHGPDISPSNRGAGLSLRETLIRSISSPHFPPLDLQAEGPSGEDIRLSNADIQTIETVIAVALSKQRKGVSIPVTIGIGLGSAGIGAAAALAADRVYGDEPVSEPTPQTRSIESFPNSFNPKEEGPVLVETKQVNPKEVFDNKATKGSLTERNSVAMTPEQYQETSPQLINGDSVILPLLIEFPEGQIPNVKFKREKGKMFGGQRLINGRLENGKIVSDGTIAVNDVLILDDLPRGSVFLSPWEGEIQLASSSGYENPDGSLKLAAFTIYTTDDKGNKLTLTMSTGKVKSLIEPSRIEYEKGTNHTKPLTRKPIRLGDPIVEILTTTHDNPHYAGQIHISALSSVEENGQRRGGAAGIQIASTPEGQAIRLDRKPR